jgi:hypothetical protein
VNGDDVGAGKGGHLCRRIGDHQVNVADEADIEGLDEGGFRRKGTDDDAIHDVEMQDTAAPTAAGSGGGARIARVSRQDAESKAPSTSPESLDGVACHTARSSGPGITMR